VILLFIRLKESLKQSYASNTHENFLIPLLYSFTRGVTKPECEVFRHWASASRNLLNPSHKFWVLNLQCVVKKKLFSFLWTFCPQASVTVTCNRTHTW